MRSLQEILKASSSEEIKSPEEAVVFVAGSLGIIKWKMLSTIHDLGRYQTLQHFVDFKGGKTPFGEDAAKMLTNTMKREDFDIFTDLVKAYEAFSSLSGVVSQLMNHFGAEKFSMEDLDYPSVFASCNIDPCIWTTDLLAGKQEFTHAKFDALSRMAQMAYNDGSSLTPQQRSGLEESMVSWMGFVPPIGLAETQPTECFGLTAYGSMTKPDEATK